MCSALLMLVAHMDFIWEVYGGEMRDFYSDVLSFFLFICFQLFTIYRWSDNIIDPPGCAAQPDDWFNVTSTNSDRYLSVVATTHGLFNWLTNNNTHGWSNPSIQRLQPPQKTTGAYICKKGGPYKIMPSPDSHVSTKPYK